METSHRLVERVLAGDPAAFDAFYDRYFDRIHLFSVRHSASRAGAEHLCRAIFESVMARLGRHGTGRDLDVWVLAVARNVVRCGASRSGPVGVAGDGAGFGAER